jgi:hypothetical protein
MMKYRSRIALIISLGLGLGLVPALSAQKPDSLSQTITRLDSIIFDAYNHCALTTMAPYFAPDLEFYHDQSGLSRGREAMLRDVKKYVCGKARRDLVPGTMAVYPLKGFGAVQTGRHMFCDPQKFTRCEEATSGVAEFVHVWQLSKGKWRITRVISYDHVSRH